MTDTGNLHWRRPASCAGESTCVEVAFAGDRVLVRNSQDPTGPAAEFTGAEWVDFVAAVKIGEFDT